MLHRFSPVFWTPLLLLASGLSLDAAVVVYEDFEALSTGELDGQAGGSGIAGDWTADTGASEVVAAPVDFEVTLPTGEVIRSEGQSLRITGNNNNAVAASLASPKTDTFFVGFLLQMEAGTIDQNDFTTLWFGEGTHIGAPAIGIKTELGPNSTDLMARVTGGSETYSATQLGIGQSYYLVAKVSKTGDSTTYNQVDFWVNPGSQDSASPETTSTGTIAFDEFNAFGIRSVNLSGDDSVLIDNLTIATEWEDLFPNIPEPSTSLLILLSLVSLISHRRRAL
ncbi:MAG: PEP-CTERM sorting domain-containing protein [Verrucomicrobiota bacterium JB023]|nr:PEP-CTERM sorting domain-containing protein [Verrucomicrobiota bacterium JB023]